MKKPRQAAGNIQGVSENEIEYAIKLIENQII